MPLSASRLLAPGRAPFFAAPHTAVPLSASRLLAPGRAPYKNNHKQIRLQTADLLMIIFARLIATCTLYHFILGDGKQGFPLLSFVPNIPCPKEEFSVFWQLPLPVL